MKIPSMPSGLNFSRALTTREKIQGQSYIKNAQELLDINNFVFIVPEQSLPSDLNNDIGFGQVNSKSSFRFYDFMKSYTGATTLKVLPIGNYNQLGEENDFYCAYGTSSLNLGQQLINLEDLTTEEYGSILDNPSYYSVKYRHGLKEDNNVDFENIVLKDSPFDSALWSAWVKFNKGDLKEIAPLTKEFENFKIEKSDILEPKALFDILSIKYNTQDVNKWSELDRNLFNEEKVSIDERLNRIEELQKENSDEINFVYFKEFLAEKSLKKARKELNNRGLKLMGDCQIGFSNDEIWANPKAFMNANICSKEWGLRALDYTVILDDNSETNKLLKRKVELFASRFDTIRFDVGWAYVNPVLYPLDDEKLDEQFEFFEDIEGYRLKEPLGDRLLKVIESEIKKVKGDDFDLNEIIYEIEADSSEFKSYDWNKNEVIEPLKNRTIIQSTCYMSDGYATIDMLQNRMKIPRNNYYYMTNNHDHIALSAYAQGIDNDNIFKTYGNDIKARKELQISPLSRELKIKKDDIKTPADFIAAKFAHIHLAKNIKMFFMDFFGRNEQFDSQIANSRKNYRYRISSDYEKEFHGAIQKGFGFNVYNSLAMAMKARSLDKVNPELYQKLLKFSDILKHEGVKTEAEANKLYA